jgi:hypothetical protein
MREREGGGVGGLVDCVMAILSKAIAGAYPNLSLSLSLNEIFWGRDGSNQWRLINGQLAADAHSHHRHFQFTFRRVQIQTRDEIGVNACMVVEFQRGKRRA